MTTWKLLIQQAKAGARAAEQQRLLAKKQAELRENRTPEMPPMKAQILDVVRDTPGITYGEIRDRINTKSTGNMRQLLANMSSPQERQLRRVGRIGYYQYFPA